MRAAAKALVPPLTEASHKGQHGKVGILGGCREYTGAPYFAGMSAVQVGADLSHIFCTPGAAPVIKGYSPEMIVLPFLPDESQKSPPPDFEDAAVSQIEAWLPRLSCLVIGPGLGDDPRVTAVSRRALLAAREAGLPLLVDGSGLNFVAKEPSLVKGYDRCILTPNLPEFGRLAAGLGLRLPGPIGPQWQSEAQRLAAALEGPVVVSKGPSDVVATAERAVECRWQGSLRRAGGQGDVLAGSISAFMCWAFPRHTGSNGEGGGGGGADALVAAAYAGCTVVRTASHKAFVEKGRSMVAGDIIPHLGPAFAWVFGAPKDTDWHVDSLRFE